MGRSTMSNLFCLVSEVPQGASEAPAGSPHSAL
jgi:hypothetical protein